jgi:1-deoxy-D-xylulose-5-phosphate reductoisomerase
MIRVAILGSTGSIGRSALEVIARHRDRFTVVALTGHRNADLLREQVERFDPKVAVLTDGKGVAEGQSAEGSTRWYSGREALLDVARMDGVDVILNALVGATGLEPSLAAVTAGHRLALANKESLVAGGALLLDASRRTGAEIVPIDSEHSAILQCVEGSAPESVQRIVLTASGGPFRGRPRSELEDVRPCDALRHPTWDMGAKITIDSATLANKALEVIEAHYLYAMPYERIDAVVHPQSVIHSFVEFVDGSVLAQLGFPTMQVPIMYSLTYPERVNDPVLRTYDPVQASPLTFEEIDHEAFPLFALGCEAGKRGRAAPAAFNAANEVAVGAFLDERVRFTDLVDIVREAVDRVGASEVLDVGDVFQADQEARAIAEAAVARVNKRIPTA